MSTDVEKRERLREHAPMLLALTEVPSAYQLHDWMSQALRTKIESYNRWITGIRAAIIEHRYPSIAEQNIIREELHRVSDDIEDCAQREFEAEPEMK